MKCLKGDCASLVVVGRAVEFRTTGTYNKARVVGEFVEVPKDLAPKEEVPVRMLEGNDGLIAVITACLPQFDEYGPTIRLRIYNARRRKILSEEVEDGQNRLNNVELLSVGSDQLLIIATSGEHRYESQILAWVLPRRGIPARVFFAKGTLKSASASSVGPTADLLIGRQTYDGIDVSTIGEHLEEWRWDSKRKSFRRPS